MFRKRVVDAAFISSIESTRKNSTASGIVAKGEIKSVIIRPGNYKSDNESATSNKLARVLGLEGEVFIGDKALLKYLENPSEYIDLGQEWNAKTGLPFVFGRFCFNRYGKRYKKLSNEFNGSKIRIPHYMMKWEAKQKGFKTKDVKEYLKLISYRIGAKEERGLALFMKKAKKL
jgi:chorismate dehydratase